MRRTLIAVLTLGTLAGCAGNGAPVILGDRYEVAGVEEGDMLKLRGGPGTGYEVKAGLPNGTVVVARECERLGAVRWCEVAVEDARGLEGYVSQTYLRQL